MKKTENRGDIKIRVTTINKECIISFHTMTITFCVIYTELSLMRYLVDLVYIGRSNVFIIIYL